MKKYIIFLVLTFSLLNCKTYFLSKPKNTTECNEYFNIKLSSIEKQKIKKLNEGELYKLDPSLGEKIRKKWMYKTNNPKLIRYFNELGLYYPKDISYIIILNYWYYLNNNNLNVADYLKNYKTFLELDAEKDIAQKSALKRSKDKFINNFDEIIYVNQPLSPTLKIPDKKFINGVFSTEFIKYKNGYIINSISTINGHSVDVQYRYHYLDLQKNQLYKIRIDKFDFIESIESIGDEVFVAGKVKGENKIIRIKDNNYENIPLKINNSNETFSKNSWIKLGAYNNEIYALQNSGLYILTESSWEKIVNLKLFTKENKSELIIPTENIKVVNSKVYFLQEIVQGINCNLFEIDICTGEVSNFWNRNQISIDFFNGINTFSVIGTDSLFVAANKVELNSLVLQTKNDFKTILYDEKLMSDSLGDNLIKVQTVIKKSGDLIIVACNGLFALKDKIITPLVYFTNTKQKIKINEINSYHYNFLPRSCRVIKNGVFLIGGKYNGLYIIDLNSNSIKCLDDKQEYKIINILEI